MEPQTPASYPSPVFTSPPTQPPLPPPQKSKKLWLILPVLLVLLATVVIGGWYVMSKKTDQPTSTAQSATETKSSSDKEAIDQVVDDFCKKLGEGVGIMNMTTGYIVSDVFSDEDLGNDNSVLRYKQVGDAAAATIDCERNGQGQGMANNLLFVKEDGAWSYVDVVQTDINSAFLCATVEKYQVSKELVSQCAPKEQAKPIPR